MTWRCQLLVKLLKSHWNESPLKQEQCPEWSGNTADASCHRHDRSIFYDIIKGMMVSFQYRVAPSVLSMSIKWSSYLRRPRIASRVTVINSRIIGWFLTFLESGLMPCHCRLFLYQLTSVDLKVLPYYPAGESWSFQRKGEFFPLNRINSPLNFISIEHTPGWPPIIN